MKAHSGHHGAHHHGPVVHEPSAGAEEAYRRAFLPLDVRTWVRPS